MLLSPGCNGKMTANATLAYDSLVSVLRSTVIATEKKKKKKVDELALTPTNRLTPEYDDIW